MGICGGELTLEGVSPEAVRKGRLKIERGYGYLSPATLLLDRGCAIDAKTRLRPLARMGDGEWRVNIDMAA